MNEPRKKIRGPTLLLLLILIIFIAGLVNLLRLRFEAGDVLPPYSSLRADPLGAKAFFESLEKTGAVRVDRNYRSLDKLSFNGPTTVFLLGLKPLDWVSPEVLKTLDQLAAGGGRLVISFYPARSSARTQDGISPGVRLNKIGQEEGKHGRTTPGQPVSSSRFKYVSLAGHWGFEYSLDREIKELAETRQARRLAGEGLPFLVSWHTALYFDRLAGPWKVVYARTGRPVIIERNFGRGTIVLCADSYLFSNEALRAEPYPALLSWMVGPAGEVIFDETHLGLNESPGIAGLARKYRLHGLWAGLILLAGLFIWKNAFSLVPPADGPGSEAEYYVSEHDSAAGLVNLLRRHIPASRLLSVCLAQWKESFPGGPPGFEDRLTRAETLARSSGFAPGAGQGLVARYNQIHRILSEGKKWHKERNT
ncbi:MAG: DUF4350 domain-containing protein [Pseudomonadota bacterium]